MPDLIKSKRIRLYGIVQGVGFRPYVSRSASRFNIKGSVCNRGSYVEVIAKGSAENIAGFADYLEKNAPERSVILKIDITDAENVPDTQSFEIIESEKERGDIFISPDIAICPECRRELFDPENRRYLHPFINCTQCGPRLTILDELPYDRARTSMKDFPMCPDCADEYYDPASRRYDAQPVCCNECGPSVYLAGRNERGPEAVTQARRILSEGGIIAVKGIGGFHLCCDATSGKSVRLLRRRKMRPSKPFAVMMKDEEAVLRSCLVNEEQRRILTGYQKPILLLEKRDESELCEEVAPGNPKVGVMLPYAPLQMLLFDYPDGISMPDCLVMTSGNVSGAPICRDDDEALRELGMFADAILSHDRMIRIRCDDSVMDFESGRPYMIRRSRGYAPLPVLTKGKYKKTVLASGGELKNTFCIGIGNMFYPSAYIGDLADPRSVGALRESIVRMETLLEHRAEAIVCDMHPGYQSTLLSEEMAKERGIPLIKVQHHFAHIASCMAENDIDTQVLGASYDGTGWGPDSTVWGGELMLCDRSGFERIGSIKPFTLVGGDMAAKQGWRCAASMLHSLYPDQAAAAGIAEKLELCSGMQLSAISGMADRGMNAVKCTSAGRLFDAVSAILGLCRESSFEGEAATSLMFAAQEYIKRQNVSAAGFDGSQDMTSAGKGMDFMTLSTDTLVKEIIDDRLDGADAGALAYRFHKSLAMMTAGAMLKAASARGVKKAVLSGGVYQNTLLLEMTASALSSEGIEVYTHHLIPPNDGGISLGQALYAQELLHGSPAGC